ncbi:hypothetical protein J2T10_001958 [Paenarthrobacter nicotinovorans]|uniref:Uncharacterized protein n=1 Tax=Paenarthrobacter nicotinovorans TaxID=29320 RepID=A0ABT9TP90_PAENI|nr:hypothetical protein [Paenarthrobacter nicotinovorans]MDQ0102312.1 hypothetical protein [Paenarthrobacter nicotinovorans]
MIDGITFLLMAATVFAAPLFIGKAREHDARLEPAEPMDWDAIEEETQTRHEDDCDAARKGER